MLAGKKDRSLSLKEITRNKEISIIATGSFQQSLWNKAKPDWVETAAYSRVLHMQPSLLYWREWSIKGVGNVNELEFSRILDCLDALEMRVFQKSSVCSSHSSTKGFSYQKGFVNKMLLLVNYWENACTVAAFQGCHQFCARKKCTGERNSFRSWCPLHCKNRYKPFWFDNIINHLY